MNIEQSLALSELGTRTARFSTKAETEEASWIAERVFARAEEQGNRMKGLPRHWMREWLASEKFYLLDLPLHFAACPHATDDNKVLGSMRADAESLEPIVVDMNKNRIGRTSKGFYPSVIVVEGKHRHAAVRTLGRSTIKAWVGEIAAQALGLIHADHQFGAQELQQKLNEQLREKYNPASGLPGLATVSGPSPWIQEVYPFENYFVFSFDGDLYEQKFKANQKKRTVVLVGEPDKVVQKYVKLEASAERRPMRTNPLETTLEVFAAGGTGSSAGMGNGPAGVSNSLSQGSGPGPSMVMKPTASPGAPSLKAKMMKKKKMRTSGYFGYKDASKTQEEKTKGGSKSAMARELEGSGYYGYRDATGEERKKMKAPGESEMAQPKFRNKKYNSEPDIEQVMGSATVRRIVTKFKKAVKAGYRPRMDAVAPPGMEKTVLGLKKHFPKGSASPFKLAWYLHNKRKAKH